MEKKITDEEVEWLVRNKSVGEYFDRFMIYLAKEEGKITPRIYKTWLAGVRLMKNIHHERK